MAIVHPRVRELAAIISMKRGRHPHPLDVEFLDIASATADETQLREYADILGVPITFASLSPIHAMRERVWNAVRDPHYKPRISIRAATQRVA